MTEREIDNYAIKYRGIVLNEITKLEKLMDSYLSRYFAGDQGRAADLFFLVFGGLRITFENKRGIFDYLQKKGKIDVEKKYPRMMADMQDIFSDRKVLAHYMLDVSKEAMQLPENHVRFFSINNKLEYKEYSQKSIDLIIDKMNKMIEIFLEFEVSAAPL